MLYVEEFLKGILKDMSNSFTFSYVILNCPGDPDQDPCLPWLYVTYHAGIIDTIVATYVDDKSIH